MALTRADDPALAGRRARRWALAATLLALAGHAAVLSVWPAAHTLMIDLQVYRAGAEHLLAGRSLYAGGVLLDLPFVYPPFAAVVFVPMLVLPLTALKVVWTAAGLALLGLIVHRSLHRMGVPPGPVLGWGTVGVVALAGWLDPVRTTLYLGQINIVVLALVLADGLGRPGSRWRGVGIGLAAALKLTPLLFVGYLLVLRRWRAAATASATFGLAGALGVLFAPEDSRTYWWDGTFLAAGRISDVAASTNHSLNGLLARAVGEGWVERAGYLVGAALLVAGTLAVAVRWHRRGAELPALTLVGLGSAAAAPFAWSHHWVWFVPLLVVLGHRAVVAGDRAAGVVGPVVLLGTAAVITARPGPGVGPIPRTGLISLFPDTYVVLFLIVLVVMALVAGRLRPPSVAATSRTAADRPRIVDPVCRPCPDTGERNGARSPAGGLMIIVNLPQLVAGQDMADEIVDELGRLTGETVLLQSGNLVNGTSAFASRIVERILRDGDAAELAVVGAPRSFENHLLRAAEKINVSSRLRLSGNPSVDAPDAPRPASSSKDEDS